MWASSRCSQALSVDNGSNQKQPKMTGKKYWSIFARNECRNSAKLHTSKIISTVHFEQPYFEQFTSFILSFTFCKENNSKLLVVSPGLVVKVGYSYQKGTSSYHSAGYWMDLFSHWLDVKFVLFVCLKRPKINEKEAKDGPFLITTINCSVYRWGAKKEYQFFIGPWIIIFTIFENFRTKTEIEIEK